MPYRTETTLTEIFRHRTGSIRAAYQTNRTPAENTKGASVYRESNPSKLRSLQTLCHLQQGEVLTGDQTWNMTKQYERVAFTTSTKSNTFFHSSQRSSIVAEVITFITEIENENVLLPSNWVERLESKNVNKPLLLTAFRGWINALNIIITNNVLMLLGLILKNGSLLCKYCICSGTLSSFLFTF